MRKDHLIAIEGAASLSGWGLLTLSSEKITDGSCIQPTDIGGQTWPVSPLSPKAEAAVNAVKAQKPYHRLDRTVQMAIAAARYAKPKAPLTTERTGVNIGSSRGATATWEGYHRTFIQEGADHLAPHASPTTTLGNVSSWVMQDLETEGPAISHSITCSTAIQAMANAEAWLKAGKADAFLAGGTEAPLTPFTMAQVQALGIHATDTTAAFPCQPFGKQAANAMALGEGAGVFWLRPRSWDEVFQYHPLAIVEATGFGQEPQNGFAGMSKTGLAFQRAMQMALQEQESGFQVDLILMHAPGTKAGDQAEANAIRETFGNREPMLYSNKWQIGHTYGASAALGVMQALHILNTQQLPHFPYQPTVLRKTRKPVRKIMVNAAGFGGNAGSLILSKPA